MSLIENIRHSLSHLLAAAVLEKFPKAKLGIGPVIENGFYYDFLLPHTFSPEDLIELEKSIRKLIKQNLSFQGKNATSAEARKIFKEQKLKLELIKELTKDKKQIKIFRTGNVFTDLCQGGHVKNTKEINPDAFKLTKTAAAYWKGDEKNPQLQRIYGVAFETKKQLEDYFKIQEEAEKRDHRVLGQQLGLFLIDETVGQGLPLWLPKGAIMRKEMEDFVLKEYLGNGYQLVRTPHIGSGKLFTVSGHLDYYLDGMYAPIEIDNEKYYLKPMNCPMHIRIYQSSQKSYRDLPVRYTELGTVYRYERSGTLHGLNRVRGFTQDDGHIICRPDQLKEEIIKAAKLTKYILESFGFKKFKVALSVRDPKNKKKYLGSNKDWDKAEEALMKGIKESGWDYIREEGEAVFYGPKMDIKITDAIGREWQISTFQVDFNLPQRFNIFYIDKDGDKKTPLMLHRALLGSIERFTGILIEHFAGCFPLWLAPVQARVLAVGEKYQKYAEEIFKTLLDNDIRAELAEANDTLSKRIRESEMQKIPYILVVGEKEEKNKTVNVRPYKKPAFAKATAGEGEMKTNTLLAKLKQEIETKKI